MQIIFGKSFMKSQIISFNCIWTNLITFSATTSPYFPVTISYVSIMSPVMRVEILQAFDRSLNLRCFTWGKIFAFFPLSLLFYRVLKLNYNNLLCDLTNNYTRLTTIELGLCAISDIDHAIPVVIWQKQWHCTVQKQWCRVKVNVD